MRNILIGHRAERDTLASGDYVAREGAPAARTAMASGLIKVITGPRRAGKSVFAFQMLAGADFAYVNFDDERLYGLTDFDELLKAAVQVYGETKTFLFDEIQNVERWELFVSRLHRQGYNILLTGSNAHLLGRELATHLTGRYREFRLLPFSFAEFLRARKFSIDESLALKERQGLLLSHLNEYVGMGGFPEVVVKGADAHSYLATLFESVLFKDIVRRYGIRQTQRLHDLGTWLVSNTAREYTLTSLKNSLAFGSVHTVENYLGYLAETFLLFTLPRFSWKAKEQVKAPRKAYCYDTGMVQAVRFRSGADTGRLLENVVAVELARRGEEFYCWKETAGKEVDFVVRREAETAELIQVCYDLSEQKTRKREIQALIAAAGSLQCGSLTVLTWDEEGEESSAAGPVHLIPAWKWLLGLEKSSK